MFSSLQHGHGALDEIFSSSSNFFFYWNSEGIPDLEWIYILFVMDVLVTRVQFSSVQYLSENSFHERYSWSCYTALLLAFFSAMSLALHYES